MMLSRLLRGHRHHVAVAIGDDPDRAGDDEKDALEERGISTGALGSNPSGAKSATNPTGAKTLKERGMGTGPSGTNPGGAGSATSSNRCQDVRGARSRYRAVGDESGRHGNVWAANAQR